MFVSWLVNEIGTCVLFYRGTLACTYKVARPFEQPKPHSPRELYFLHMYTKVAQSLSRESVWHWRDQSLVTTSFRVICAQNTIHLSFIYLYIHKFKPRIKWQMCDILYPPKDLPVALKRWSNIYTCRFPRLGINLPHLWIVIRPYKIWIYSPMCIDIFSMYLC